MFFCILREHIVFVRPKSRSIFVSHGDYIRRLQTVTVLAPTSGQVYKSFFIVDLFERLKVLSDRESFVGSEQDAGHIIRSAIVDRKH